MAVECLKATRLAAKSIHEDGKSGFYAWGIQSYCNSLKGINFESSISV
jgi:hypothetical protein